jgi:apolipoprotein N-acyltransferase
MQSFLFDKKNNLPLYTLILFLLGYISGTQFSFYNQPILTVLCFSCFYLLTQKEDIVLKWYAFGVGFFSYSHSWISDPLDAFGNLYAVFKPYVFVFVPFLLGISYAISGWIIHKKKAEGWKRVFICSSLLTVFEYIRCEYIPAVPLGHIALLWVPYLSILQTASVVGVYGLSFLTLFIAFGCAESLIQKSSKQFLILILLGASIALGGLYRLYHTPLVQKKATVQIVPTHWLNNEKNQSMELRFDHLKELCKRAFLEKETSVFLLFPETVLEFGLIQNDQAIDFKYTDLREYISKFLRVDAVMGCSTLFKQDRYNSAIVINDKTIRSIYHKRLLAPFGEFRPYGLKTLMDWLHVYALDEFARGARWQPLFQIKGLKVQPVICYEGSYTQRVLASQERPDVLAVMTNDSWFKDNGTEQMALSHTLRAVEEGISLVRTANCGFSGYVSPLGTFSYSTSKSTQTVPLFERLPTTFYRFFLDLGYYSLDLLMIVLGIVALI